MDNSGKVWLIRTSTFFTTHTHTRHRIYFVLLCIDTHTHTHTFTTQHSMVNFGRVRAVSLKFNCNMRDIEHARVVPSGTSHHAEQTLRSLLCEAGHTSIYSIKSPVGKCIIEPSRQSRIRKRSFWSHRRSTVRWETALSSKERSRRVNCPMLVPYTLYIFFKLLFFYF